MTAPLLAVDAPSLLYRAFYALPGSIRGTDDRPVNALLGCANLVLWVVERHAPRAVVLTPGAEAAAYRARPTRPTTPTARRCPTSCGAVGRAAPAFFGAFGWPRGPPAISRPTTSSAPGAREADAGGARSCSPATATCSSASRTDVRVLFPRGGKDGPEDYRARTRSGARYGVDPAQVPDFIALRGDPSDGLPGARGIGEKTARDLLRDHGDLRRSRRRHVRRGCGPRVAQTLRDQADELRTFREIATLRDVDVPRPPDAPTDWRGAPRRPSREHGLRRPSPRLRGARPR